MQRIIHIPLACSHVPGRHVNRLQHLLSELWLSLLHTAQDQVARGAVGQLVQASSDADHRNDVKIPGTPIATAQTLIHTAKSVPEILAPDKQAEAVSFSRK